MRVLISGTTGWIGGELAKKLVAEGSTVSGVGRRPTVIDGVESLQVDIMSNDSCKQISERKYDVAVHLAGSLGWCTLEQAVDINIAGTRRFVQAAIDSGAKRIVVASSVATIGTQAPTHPPSKLPMKPDHKFEGGPWSYAFSKYSVEQLIRYMASDPAYKGIDFVLVRVGATVTDPPEIRHFDGIVNGKEVSWLVDPAACIPKPYTAAEPKVFPEDALCAVALSDQVSCLLSAVKAPLKEGVRTVACVAPKVYASDTVPELMRSWYGEEAASRIDMSYYEQPGHERDPIYDLDVGRQELGWEPKLDLLQSRPEALAAIEAKMAARAKAKADAAAAAPPMKPVNVVVVKRVPKESEEQWLRMANELAEATWKEDGCLQYEFVRGDADTFIIVEKWTSMTHLEAHFATPHFVKLVPAMDAISTTVSIDKCSDALAVNRAPRTTRILVLFDSNSTSTQQMAELVAEGARQLNHMDVRIRCVPGPDNHWDCKDVRQAYIPANFGDVLWADGVACGSPTNLGCISWRMKKFWDDMSQAGFWSRLDGKIGCSFSSVGGEAGGAELVNMAMNSIMMNYGFACFGVTDYVSFKNTLHYGAAVAKAPREEADKMACRRLGRRLAEFTGFYISHRPETHPNVASKAVDYNFWKGPIPPRSADPADLLKLNLMRFDGPVECEMLSAKALDSLPVYPATLPTDSAGKLVAGPGSGSASGGAMKLALVYTKMEDYVHGSTAAAASFVSELLTAKGWRTVVTDDAAAIEKPTAEAYDLIVLVNNSGKIFNPECEALTDHLANGRPVLGVHAALACFLDGVDAVGATPMNATCPLIRQVFGAHFLNHPPPQDGTVKMHREAGDFWRAKDMLGCIPDTFTHHDEFFNFSCNPVAEFGVTPLASVDESTYTGGTMGEQHPIVWCREYGDKNAKIFYCGLGHFSSEYTATGEKKFVAQFLRAGLKYLTGQ
uniref:ABM domain-containing protein n=1 Tax=Chrysotila carterae TaxID=13221 RepID=A0A7S4C2Z4_CHRCT|mmetsp:Transcript_29951/g.65515  ORF Transcript_29951/g.65515 Transcript_29951/m.65515 type:complete len:952 (-) Transcript_29951:148-3003(-)